MKEKIITLLLVTTITSGTASAGQYNLTHHSRANCANNESISWQAGHSYWLWVVSRHKAYKQDHQVIADWDLTWRSAAVHWGEGRGGWTVEGHHWMRQNSASMPYQVQEEYVSDCSIYDGWWD